MHKLRCDTYAMQAIIEVIGEARKFEPFRRWSLDESRAISRRQAEMRQELGLPEPTGV